MELQHILIAEDDPRDLELTLAALEEYHFANEIFVVHDGEEALDYLYRRGIHEARPARNPVAILLDLKMPKVNGIEVLRIIKADAELKTIPVVVLTASREEPDLSECHTLGINAYLVKPVDFVEVMKAVKPLGVFWVAIEEPPAEKVLAAA